MMSASGKLVMNNEVLSVYADQYRGSTRSMIVLTFGAFDIVHLGHLLYLERARSFGHVLMVGITSDKTVRAVKGNNRPINSEQDRAFIVAGFSCVDQVFVFDGDDPAMIQLIRPDICVYSETSEKKLVDRQKEQEILSSYGGRIEYLPAQTSRHTSDIIRELRHVV